MFACFKTAVEFLGYAFRASKFAATDEVTSIAMHDSVHVYSLQFNPTIYQASYTSTCFIDIAHFLSQLRDVRIGVPMRSMPGDMPKLFGVLLLDRFALGSSELSYVVGWSYHFWNGAGFGIIFNWVSGRAA